VAIVAATLGFLVGVADAHPWALGKNKLPRLSSHPRDISIENLTLSPGRSFFLPGHRK
jgi:hypothetical protein